MAFDPLNGLSKHARDRVLDGICNHLSSQEIAAIIVDEGEIVTAEAIENTRVLCRGFIDQHMATRTHTSFVSIALTNKKAIDQSVMHVALEQQALMSWHLSNDLLERWTI